MFGFSFIALSILAFLAVMTAALVLVLTKGGENKGSCGCCAGCGLVAAIFLAFALGVGAVLLFVRHSHNGSHIRIQHLNADQAMDRFEQSMERLERRLERTFDH